MYQNHISTQEQYSAFDVVKDTAMVAANPINWYRYNPNMFSMRRGQIRVPLSRQGMQKWANRARKVPGADWVINKLKMTGIQNLGGPVGTKEAWIGSAAWKDDTRLFSRRYVMCRSAYNKYVDSLQPPLQIGYNKPGPSVPANRALVPVSKTSSRLEYTIPGQKMLEYKPGPNFVTPDTRAVPVGPSYGDPSPSDALKQARKSAMDKTSMAKRSAFARASAKVSEQVVEKTEKGLKWVRGVHGQIPYRKFGMRAGKLAMRGGVGALKLGAALGLASIAWDTMNLLFEPLGRAAIQQTEGLYQQYEKIRMPELGGQISMEYLTTGAATERQRALQAISKSRLNARSGMGLEASNIHQ